MKFGRKKNIQVQQMYLITVALICKTHTKIKMKEISETTFWKTLIFCVFGWMDPICCVCFFYNLLSFLPQGHPVQKLSANVYSGKSNKAETSVVEMHHEKNTYMSKYELIKKKNTAIWKKSFIKSSHLSHIFFQGCYGK